MAIRYIPPKRFTDVSERVTNEVMDKLGRGGMAIVEPETIRLADLDQDYAIAQIQAQVVGAHDSLTFGSDFTITAGQTKLVPDVVFFPTISSIDTVIWIEQKHPSIIFSPFVEVNPNDVDGSNPFEVRFIAFNHDTADKTITAGTAYPVYAFFQQPTVQAKLPNAILKVGPGLEWVGDNGDSLNLPMTPGNLNATALPTVSIFDNSLGPIELNSADVGQLTEKYSGLPRRTLTVSGNHSIPVGPAVVLGTVSVTGAIQGFSVVQIGQVGLSPLYTGYVSATDTVTVLARNNFASVGTLTVHGGQKLRVFVS